MCVVLNRMILALAGLVMALSTAAAAPKPKPPLVFAAASLQESLSRAAEIWAAAGHPKPALSFAASSALARQIIAGAPADLFVSADEEWMNALAAKNLLHRGSRVSFLGNRLVLIAPAAQKRPLPIRRNFPLAWALGSGRLAIADPDAVPAGKYAKAALTSLGVWPSVEKKLARAENVRAALLFVERGETPYGIVYETDARASSKVRVVGIFPESSHPAIYYPVARLKGGNSPDAAAFQHFLLSMRGKAIFKSYGFSVRGR